MIASLGCLVSSQADQEIVWSNPFLCARRRRPLKGSTAISANHDVPLAQVKGLAAKVCGLRAHPLDASGDEELRAVCNVRKRAEPLGVCVLRTQTSPISTKRTHHLHRYTTRWQSRASSSRGRTVRVRAGWAPSNAQQHQPLRIRGFRGQEPSRGLLATIMCPGVLYATRMALSETKQTPRRLDPDGRDVRASRLKYGYMRV